MSEKVQDWALAAATARRDVRSFDMPQGIETQSTAYTLQDAYVTAVGKAIGGYKLAVNGAVQMAHFGVSEPVSARVFADEIHSSGAVLPRPGFSDVTVEPELAAVIGPSVANLSSPVNRADTLAVIERFHPAIELIDLRGTVMPEIGLGQAIALNVFNAGIVLGSDGVAPGDLDLPNLYVRLDEDGTLAAETTGTAPQDPVEAVMWLINHLFARGIRPETGMVVMCGTHVPLRTLDPGVGKVTVEMSGIGSVAFSLSG